MAVHEFGKNKNFCHLGLPQNTKNQEFIIKQKQKTPLQWSSSDNPMKKHNKKKTPKGANMNCLRIKENFTNSKYLLAVSTGEKIKLCVLSLLKLLLQVYIH